MYYIATYMDHNMYYSFRLTQLTALLLVFTNWITFQWLTWLKTYKVYVHYYLYIVVCVRTLCVCVGVCVCYVHMCTCVYVHICVCVCVSKGNSLWRMFIVNNYTLHIVYFCIMQFNTIQYSTTQTWFSVIFPSIFDTYQNTNYN